jgi:hypothetical protein
LQSSSKRFNNRHLINPEALVLTACEKIHSTQLLICQNNYSYKNTLRRKTVPSDGASDLTRILCGSPVAESMTHFKSSVVKYKMCSREQ